MMLHEHIYEDMKQSRSNEFEHLLLLNPEHIKEPADEKPQQDGESGDQEEDSIGE